MNHDIQPPAAIAQHKQYKSWFCDSLGGFDACLLVQLKDKCVHLLLLDVLDVGLDELFKHLSTHHLGDSEFGQACPVVSHPVLRVVVRPYLLTAVQGRNLRFPLRLLFFHRPLVLNFKQLLLQYICSPLLVGILASLFLDEHSQTCRDVDCSAGGFYLVDSLSSGSA